MEPSVTKKYIYEVIDRIINDCKNTGCSAAEALMLVKSSVHDMTPDTAQVMTLEEVKEAQICWIEDRNIDFLYPAIYRACGNDRYAVFTVPDFADDIEDISLYPDEYSEIVGNERWLEEDEINEWWRPWSQKPTEEQMESQAWYPQSGIFKQPY